MKLLYLVMQFDEKLDEFQLQGIYTKKQKAFDTCKTTDWCVVEMIENVELPEERDDTLLNIWYPLRKMYKPVGGNEFLPMRK